MPLASSPPVPSVLGASAVHVPSYATSAGEEAIELAAIAGLHLDQWQAETLTHALGERESDGKWSAFEVGVMVSRQNGKGPHALDTPILTSDGWTTFGEIRAGTSVYGSDGRPTRVVATSPVYAGERCFEVSFTDGSRYVVGSGHLWRVRHKGRRRWEDVDTATIARSVGARRTDTGRMSFNWRVRCDAVPQTPTADLPIDPYIFGLWLGDGKHDAAQITCGDEDAAHVRSEILAAGYELASEHRGNAEYQPWQISFTIGTKWSRSGFRPRLRDLGVYKAKAIPAIYLSASPAQRVALMQGLMDSDGSIATTNDAPQVEFSTSSDRLAQDFHRLARSLGIRVTARRRETARKPNWRFLWTPTFCPFRLARKAQKFAAPASSRHELMSITAVRPVDTVPVRCIQVAAADGVYLVGHTFTPTHNSIIEARSLAGLFLLGERLIVHTAHQFDTSLEAFRRLLFLIESTPDLEQRVQRVSRSHGEEGIELRGGQRIRFRTRTKGGGRGFSGDCVFLDEAMILPEETRGALMPTLSARPNPQLWYLGSAVDQQIHEHGRSFARIRERGRKGDDPRLFWVEYSAPAGHPDEVTTAMAQDPDVWDASNPATTPGRIQHEYIEAEQRSLVPRTFAVERLGVGDWPDLDVEDGDSITKTMWEACEDPDSVLADPIRIAFDVHPKRAWASIVAAGLNEFGQPHVEIVERRQGTAWLPGRLKDLQRDHDCGPILFAGRSAASASSSALDQLGVRHEAVDAAEFGEACGTFLDAVGDATVRHIGQSAMQAAALGAKQRPSGDTLVWTRRGSAVDISPLCAATIAHHAATKGKGQSVYQDRDLLIL